MKKLTRKALHAAMAPLAKATHRYANNFLIGMKPNPRPAGVVVHHGEEPLAGVVQWEGFTLEASMIRRARVVCNVPTPFSLFTFNYCLKLDGKQLAHGGTLPEFLDNAMRAVKRIEAERIAA